MIRNGHDRVLVIVRCVRTAAEQFALPGRKALCPRCRPPQSQPAGGAGTAMSQNDCGRCLSVMAGRVPATTPTVEAQMAGTRPAMTMGRPCAARPLAPARPYFHGSQGSARPQRRRARFAEPCSNPRLPQEHAMPVSDFTARLGTGEDRSLTDYRGKVLLIVNVASQCGFTP